MRRGESYHIQEEDHTVDIMVGMVDIMAGTVGIVDIMVGDTTVDIRSGRSAGAQTVGVLCGFGEEAELRRQGADSILATTADLSSLLSQVAAE